MMTSLSALLDTALRQILTIATDWEVRTAFHPPAAQQTSTTQMAEPTLTDSVEPNSFQTINNTMDDVGLRTVTQIAQSVLQEVSPLPDQTPTKMMSRLVPLGTLDWSFSDNVLPGTPLSVIFPVGLLMNADSNSAVTQFYQYARTDCELHIRLNSNAFYQGALMITAVPTDCAMTNLSYSWMTNAYARSWLNPITLSASSADTIVLELPWLRPERMLPVDALTTTSGPSATINPWTVYIDVLSKLSASTDAAPSTLTIQFQGRLVNPKVYFPVDPTPVVVRQSGQAVTPGIRKASGRPTIVSRNRSRLDPVQEAMSTVSTSASTSVPSTVISSIDSVVGGIEDALSVVQPITSLLGGLGLFDKPNDVNPAMMNVPIPFGNFCRSDVKDYSQPLTLYKTSYASSFTMPGGGDWTWRDLAMHPAIAQSATLTSLITSTSITLPLYHIPCGLAIASHQIWRTSFRVKIQMFCSKFVSARLIFVYSPPGVVSTNSIEDQVTDVVQIVGDTEFEYTLPYIQPYDFLPTAANGFGQLDIQIYPGTTIVTNDTTTSPSIGVVFWVAAGPDCQFSQPQAPVLYTPIPAPVVYQSVIQKDFSRNFRPFVEGCEYYTDNHCCVSETSERLIDVLKRYQNVRAASDPAYRTNISMMYDPNVNTLGWIVVNSFLFHRGGVHYKFFRTSATPPPNFLIALNTASTSAGCGQSGYIGYGNSSDNAEVDFAIPWMFYTPYYERGNFLVSSSGPQPGVVAPIGISEDDFNTYTFQDGSTSPIFGAFTIVRDDYQMGYLIPPPELYTDVPRKSPKLTPETLCQKWMTAAHATALRKPSKIMKVRPVGVQRMGQGSKSADGKAELFEFM